LGHLSTIYCKFAAPITGSETHVHQARLTLEISLLVRGYGGL
jgi:hypothetical protein